MGKFKLLGDTKNKIRNKRVYFLELFFVGTIFFVYIFLFVFIFIFFHGKMTNYFIVVFSGLFKNGILKTILLILSKLLLFPFSDKLCESKNVNVEI
ncbi:MAG: hypothetical protein Ta2E_00370 [Mycoplasmoidaceae bacterium]|nr:MAG: hypothetical protein Ta2E_00370 [Mycoplasmoidaceae bacterium]